MIAENETAIHRPSATRPTNRHPPAHESRRMIPKPPEPGRPVRAGRRDNDRLRPVKNPRDFPHLLSWRQIDPGFPIRIRHPLYRSVQEDRPYRRIESRESSLGLAQGIADQKRCLPLLLVALPPLMDLLDDHGLRLPPVDWQSEGALRDEEMALHQLVGRASPVSLSLVIARDDRNLAPLLDPDLR